MAKKIVLEGIASLTPIEEDVKNVLVEFDFTYSGLSRLCSEKMWIPKSVNLETLRFPVNAKCEMVGGIHRSFTLTAITGTKF